MHIAESKRQERRNGRGTRGTRGTAQIWVGCVACGYFSLFSIRSKKAHFLVALHVRVRGGAGGPSAPKSLKYISF